MNREWGLIVVVPTHYGRGGSCEPSVQIQDRRKLSRNDKRCLSIDFGGSNEKEDAALEIGALDPQ